MRLTLLDKSIINMVKKSNDIKKGPDEKSTTEVKSFMEDIDRDDENKVIEILKKYFIETSIHGLKYIFEVGRHGSERLFWIISELFMFILCFYLIYSVCMISSLGYLIYTDYIFAMFEIMQHKAVDSFKLQTSNRNCMYLYLITNYHL